MDGKPHKLSTDSISESMSTASGFYVFATLEMMNEAMNKAAPNFGDSDKVWNQEAVRKAIYSLD